MALSGSALFKGFEHRSLTEQGWTYDIIVNIYLNEPHTRWSISLEHWYILEEQHIDPRGRPTVMAGNDHYFHTCRT